MYIGLIKQKGFFLIIRGSKKKLKPECCWKLGKISQNVTAMILKSSKDSLKKHFGANNTRNVKIKW